MWSFERLWHKVVRRGCIRFFAKFQKPLPFAQNQQNFIRFAHSQSGQTHLVARLLWESLFIIFIKHLNNLNIDQLDGEILQEPDFGAKNWVFFPLRNHFKHRFVVYGKLFDGTRTERYSQKLQWYLDLSFLGWNGLENTCFGTWT